VARYREHGVPWPTTMKTRPFWFYRQSGVIPYRISDGAIEVLLVSSRGGARWVVPKGVVEIGMSPVESACKEAYEEGGVRGNASEAPIGEYTYEKWGGDCTVSVYLLRVSEVLDDWPESDERTRRWVSIGEASEAVREPGLRAMIGRLEDLVA
jgi:phosphohistidine phosphatase